MGAALVAPTLRGPASDGRVARTFTAPFGLHHVPPPIAIRDFPVSVFWHGRLDVLVNNAGRIYGAHGASIDNTPAAVLAEAFDNNALGAYRMMRRALPMMAAQGFGRIVNVFSGMGALSDMGSGAVPYRVSKTALNALTVLAAKEAAPGVKVNAVCPGWVQTDMGGPSAPRRVEEGTAGIVWAATLPEDGPSGGFFRDGRAIDW